MYSLPTNAPTNLYEAFAYIGTVQKPTIDDFKLMVLLEAAGKAMYDDLAADADDPEVRQWLLDSGDDEYLHAQRFAKILTLLTGEPHSVPDAEENPYLVGWEKPTLSVALVEKLISAEAGGEALFESWARSCPNPEAASLLRQSGQEEAAHAERMRLIRQRLTG